MSEVYFDSILFFPNLLSFRFFRAPFSNTSRHHHDYHDHQKPVVTTLKKSLSGTKSRLDKLAAKGSGGGAKAAPAAAAAPAKPTISFEDWKKSLPTSPEGWTNNVVRKTYNDFFVNFHEHTFVPSSRSVNKHNLYPDSFVLIIVIRSASRGAGERGSGAGNTHQHPLETGGVPVSGRVSC